eukprot:2058044-Alexandrium_andersonii.AAC.1
MSRRWRMCGFCRCWKRPESKKCGASVAAGSPACPACAVTLRLVRSLGLVGRRLSPTQRDWVARYILILSEMIEGQLQ